MLEWKLETIPIKSLKPHKKNPRQITKEHSQRLEGIIDEFGLIDKPILNQDLTIIGGHQRIRILKKKKVKEVQCWIPDRQLTDEEIDHLCIGLNLNQGHWDYDILANEWEPLDLLNWGFTEEQLVGKFKETEEVLGEDKEEDSKKKKHSCPNCGHEF
jgi:ParB-like chromosome segregation protein Spo0J